MLIGVEFQQKDGSFSKTYYYKIKSDHQINYATELYNIKNEKGYTYNNSLVRFLRAWKDEKDCDYDLKEIVEVKKFDRNIKYLWFPIVPKPVGYGTISVDGLRANAEKAGEEMKTLSDRLYRSYNEQEYGTSCSSCYTNSNLWEERDIFFDNDEVLRELATPYTTKDSISTITSKIDNLDNKKEKNNMFNFEFGKANNTGAGFSMYGLTFSTDDNSCIAYKDGGWVDVPKEFIIKGMSDMLYMMPVAKTAVKANDYIRHNGRWIRVVEVTGTTLKAEDIYNKTVIEILPTRSPFGFDFYTKLVNMFDGFGGETKASAENPFGNMWMFMLMGDSKSSFKDMLPFMMMSGGDFKFDMSNPMMMYFLLNK